MSFNLYLRFFLQNSNTTADEMKHTYIMQSSKLTTKIYKKSERRYKRKMIKTESYNKGGNRIIQEDNVSVVAI